MRAKAIALTSSLVFVAAAMGFADSPHMGTWKLNEAKSKLTGKAKNNTVVYAPEGDQIKITVDGVDEKALPCTMNGPASSTGRTIRSPATQMLRHVLTQ